MHDIFENRTPRNHGAIMHNHIMHGTRCRGTPPEWNGSRIIAATRHFLAQRTVRWNMKHGKYDLRKSSSAGFGTSYSWYYKKNENPAATWTRKRCLARLASVSTLFSDYTNQINIFENNTTARKCRKTISCFMKARNKQNGVVKTVDMQPFIGNFYYGKPLAGFDNLKMTEDEIAYMPDSDTKSPSEDTCLTEGSVNLSTLMDAPEVVKNPLYGSTEEDLPTPFQDYLASTSENSQFRSSSCTEIKDPMYNCSIHGGIYDKILKDYKRCMKEWNSTLIDLASDNHTGKNDPTMCTSETAAQVLSPRSTTSCGKLTRKSYRSDSRSYEYTRAYGENGDSATSKRPNTGNDNGRKRRNLDRTYSFYKEIESLFQKLKMKAKFTKDGRTRRNSKYCYMERLYDEYDSRLKEWRDSVARCSPVGSSARTGYKEEIEKPENQPLLPATLVGHSDVLFGNLQELFTFHQDVFLKDLEKCISATELVALCFVHKRETFFRLYSYYCQNIPRSERLRETLVDTHLFLQACQLRLGHKLPLAAYLLKPVQRITKYQLLLKDLLRYSECGSVSTGLQEALDCMLVVLKCVNDSMHQIAITGFPFDLTQQGELLMQGSFLVVSDSKRDLRLRLRARRRHIFLYEKAILFCKPAAKNNHNKATYHFKHDLQMSQVGLTESVKGDPRKFEVWRQGRSEVHTITATSVDIKRAWVARIKRVLLDQLEELKGERVRQYGAPHHRALSQASSWEISPASQPQQRQPASAPRTASCDTHDDQCWSTDPSEDEDDEQAPVSTQLVIDHGN
ncbi:Guanine nucleotide exchange factor DBS [Eumeta japonica]|uniref:Guanine nucleotide exchange factor DBS n=1 Tax=Eumeta variegata TaxID=151549 RepID=A0A4C1W3F3_EUMVA|nr:Guanine nucleotide exchange factor DBS [Eumeta japonica]